MKNKFIFLILLFILIIPISYAYCTETSYTLDVNLNLEAIEEDRNIVQLSRFQFPDFREEDFLVIKELRIFNTGNCTIFLNPEIEITLSNDEEQINDSFCLHKINGSILPYSSYVIYRNENWDYYDSNNNKIRLCGKHLAHLGRWETEIDFPNFYRYVNTTSSKPPNIFMYSTNQFVNGKRVSPVGFRVFTSAELELRELAKETNNLSKIAIAIAIVGIIFPLWYDYRKNKKKQRELMLALLTEISHVAKASEFYKEIFLRNITTNVDRLKDLNKELKPFKRYLETKNEKKLKEMLRIDKTISKSIKLFSKKLSENYSSLYSGKKPLEPHLPPKIRQINSGFYLKSLDSKVKGEYNKETLINSLISLEEMIGLINSNVEFINNNFLIILNENMSINPWFAKFYKIFWSLEDLDNQVNTILEELLKNEYVKNYFNNNLNINNLKSLYTIKQRF